MMTIFKQIFIGTFNFVARKSCQKGLKIEETDINNFFVLYTLILTS